MVLFDLYIPVDWKRFPFSLLVCRRNHVHFPPPPTKLPEDIANEVIQAIEENDVLDLTARMCMLYI
jgi:hypothetical protein